MINNILFEMKKRVSIELMIAKQKQEKWNSITYDKKNNEEFKKVVMTSLRWWSQWRFRERESSRSMRENEREAQCRMEIERRNIGTMRKDERHGWFLSKRRVKSNYIILDKRDRFKVCSNFSIFRCISSLENNENPNLNSNSVKMEFFVKIRLCSDGNPPHLWIFLLSKYIDFYFKGNV